MSESIFNNTQRLTRAQKEANDKKWFSSGGLMEVPKGAGGEIGRDNPPQLMQSIMS